MIEWEKVAHPSKLKKSKKMGHPTVDLHSFFANTDLATFLIQIPIQL